MKGRVQGTYQVVHEGKAYTEGDVVDAPESLIREWISRGYMIDEEEAKAREKAEAKSSSDSGSKSESKKSDSK